MLLDCGRIEGPRLLVVPESDTCVARAVAKNNRLRTTLGGLTYRSPDLSFPMSGPYRETS
jgi:hypothetical protein